MPMTVSGPGRSIGCRVGQAAIAHSDNAHVSARFASSCRRSHLSTYTQWRGMLRQRCRHGVRAACVLALPAIAATVGAGPQTAISLRQPVDESMQLGHAAAVLNTTNAQSRRARTSLSVDPTLGTRMILCCWRTKAISTSTSAWAKLARWATAAMTSRWLPGARCAVSACRPTDQAVCRAGSASPNASAWVLSAVRTVVTASSSAWTATSPRRSHGWEPAWARSGAGTGTGLDRARLMAASAGAASAAFDVAARCGRGSTGAHAVAVARTSGAATSTDRSGSKTDVGSLSLASAGRLAGGRAKYAANRRSPRCRACSR